MNSNSQKIIINLNENKHINWRLCLKNELKNIKSNSLEINCKNLDLSCTEILELIEIASQYDCKVINFFSSSLTTIISSKSLGYKSQFIIENHSNRTLKIN